MKLFENIRGKDAIKNIINLYSSQLVSVGFSIFIFFYIPRFIGVEEFSYWQLFLFYGGYTGMLYLGLNDGLYLRLGGKRLTMQACHEVSSQLWIATGFIMTLSIISFIVISSGLIPALTNSDLKFVILSVAVFAVINDIFGYCSSICQALNRFKVYTTSSIMERLIMVAFLIVMIVFSIKKFEYIVICWIASLAAVTVRILVKNQDLFLSKITISRAIFREMGINIVVGINLMLSNVSAMLIIGICRFFISEHYPIEIFGFVSFSLSLCLFCLQFISKIGIGIYPLLKQKSEEFHQVFFAKMDYLLTVLMPLCIILFPILILIVKYFLPNYYPSLTYLAIFFPLCVFTVKIDMLYSTYLKVLRHERYLLKINAAIMLLSAAISALGIYVLDNLILTLIGVCACIIIKSYCMQNHICKALSHVNMPATMCIDIIFSVVYLLLIGIGIDFSIVIYIMLFSSVLNLFFQRRKVRENLNYIFVARK